MVYARGMKVSGQEFTEEIIARIRATIASTEGITRGRLSRMVCEWMGWHHRDGRTKEMNCRVALGKLERRGFIELPEAKAVDFKSRDGVEEMDWPKLKMTLAELGEVELVLVGRDKVLSRLWRQMLREHHPLGDGPLCGAQLRYLVKSSAGWLGGLSFSAAAWRLKARDEWIGWDDRARSGGLLKIVGNSRFLILPSVEVPNLASHVLGCVLKRLVVDWRNRYDEEPVLVETFVDPSQNQGTCYLAANWTELGLTKGRGRQDRRSEFKLEPKQIFVYPLRADWQTILCEGRAPLPVPVTALPKVSRMVDWAVEEFGSCELGDSRLTERLQIMARDFFAQPSANLPQSCGSRAKTKAAYRFLDHEETSMEKVLQPHYLATENRIKREPVVLAVQDTSSVNYSGLKETEGLGPIGTTVDGAQGLILHSTLTFNVVGTPLGLIDAQCWRRDPAEFGKKRDKLSIEEKESSKWLKSYRAAAEVQTRCPDSMIVSMGDREADIYELFHEALADPKGPKLLVRAAKNRQVGGEHTRLWETLEQQPLAGEQVLQVPRSGNKKQQSRQAHMEIRYAPVTLRAPQGKKDKDGKKLADITVFAVLAQENHADVAKDALEWLLLTTLPLENLEQAKEKLAWYAKRWGIEVFHRIIKSGCRIEYRQLCEASRLETCLAIDMVVAWRIYHMTQLARETPDASCEECFSADEWKSVEVYTSRRQGLSLKKAVVPTEPPTLRKIIRLVAGLGGFLGRKCDGEPGAQTIWRGLGSLSYLAAMYGDLTNSTEPLGVPQVPQAPVSRKTRYG